MQDPAQAIGAVFRERYEIQGTLGEGGFGTVYKARQHATGQLVAIKVLRLPDGGPIQAHEKRIARFQREMQICAQMHHPNIVRLIDSGQAEGGVVYSVFEFLPGKNLAELLAEEGRLDPAEARHFMLQVLDALGCAHAVGVVHRDLKPANIMIVATGARRNALVLDFGIGALTEEARRDEGARITLTNESIGTPAYAAPEQLRGLPPTPRSDLYAWGLVFLECLTGKRVVEGETVAEVVFKQLSADPIPIPDAIADHALGRMLRRATAKDATTRDVTTEGLLRELEGCDVSGLRPRTGPVRIDPAPADAATATVQLSASGPGARGPRLVEGERRQITAVCCSLGPTGTGSKPADVEELDHVLGVQQEACSEIARRLGGHVAGALGDAVLFYFGYPTAREDDARHAARAALAMAAEVRRRTAALEEERKIKVDLRIGIHTGLVVSREIGDPSQSRIGFVVGTTPKLAARLAGLAEPGGILVSGDTQRLLRKHFVLEASGMRVVDDSTHPVEVFALQEGSASAGVRDVPLVGRDGELAMLLDRWGKARGGAGQAVLVSGEPGIGKSRLARELAERIAGEPHTWLECRATPDSTNSAFYPIIDLIDRMLDPQREVKPDGKTSKLEALLSLYGFDLAEAMPLFAPLLSLSLPPRWAPLDVSPQKKRELTRNAVLSLLFEMAEKEPVALVIEDLHWADPSTVELLGQLVGEVGSARVLAIFTARPEFSPPWSSTSVLPVQLGRFGRPEVEQMAARVTGGRPLPPEVLEAIAARTDGVPLFVEELVLTLIEAGALVEKDGGYALAKPLAEVAIPATLRDSLVARLDRLGRAKETAQVASAIGREFTFELLRAVSPLEEVAALQDLDKLVEAELVFRKRRIKAAAYIFKHALVRDAAYESMLKRSRVDVHARIARALSEKFPEIVVERPELMAHHLAAAEERREAIVYAQKAARGALQRSAYAESAEQTRQALSWALGLDDAKDRIKAELDLSSILMPAVMALGGAGDARLVPLTARILELSDAVGASPHRLPTLYALTTYHHLHSNRAKALDLGKQLVALAGEAGDVAADLAGHAILAQCLIMAGRYEEARAAAERALSLYDAAAHRSMILTYGVDLKTFAHSMLSYSLAFLGYLDRAAAEADRAIAWGRELNMPNMVARSLWFSSFAHRMRRDRARTLEMTRESMELADRYGLPFSKAWAGLFHGWATQDAGQISGIVAVNQARGEIVCSVFLLSLVAEAEAAHGQTSAALGHLDEALRFAEEQGEHSFCAGVLTQKAALLLAQDPGNLDGAEACLVRALEIARAQHARTEELGAAVGLAGVLRKKGRAQEAREILAGAYGWFTEGLDTEPLREARSLLDALDRSEGSSGAR